MTLKHPLLILVILLLPFAGTAQLPSSVNRENLVNLPPRLTVYVDPIQDQSARSSGLTEDWITTEAELRLRRSSFTVLSRKEWLASTENIPTLWITVSLVHGEDSLSGLYSYSIIVELMQGVYLRRGAEHSVVVIWQDGAHGVVGRNHLVEVRSTITDLIDKLTNDYLAANPKSKS